MKRRAFLGALISAGMVAAVKPYVALADSLPVLSSAPILLGGRALKGGDILASQVVTVMWRQHLEAWEIVA